jgi:DnaJ-class molecular chaperone
MVTPQQFLESFLQEKASVYAQANLHLAPVYAKYFGEPLSQRAQDFMLGHKIEVVVEDVKQAADSASAIIRDHFRTGDIRTRYHLASFGETWKIIRVDRECLRCRATGGSEGPRCPKCGGEGWYDTSKDAA